MNNYPVTSILDTTAVEAYVAGTGGVSKLLAGISERDERAALPVLCLAGAYRRATPETALLLDVLQNLPAVLVTPVAPDDAFIIGGWTRIMGAVDIAHAAMESASRRLPIVTSRRELINRVLPKEWPIIDL